MEHRQDSGDFNPPARKRLPQGAFVTVTVFAFL